MHDWSFWRWIVGLLGKRCEAYVDTAPKQVRCERRYGHINRHRQGKITFQIGTRGD